MVEERETPRDGGVVAIVPEIEQTAVMVKVIVSIKYIAIKKLKMKQT